MTARSQAGTGRATAPRSLGPTPRLDGLRGLAILAVLGTHVVFLDSGSATWSLRGGFLGVDVFLGLSAFLISAVLLREIDQRRARTGGGAFDAAHFARRRFRRLYPAMSVPRGLPRLRALFDNWMKRTSVELDSGCIYISGAVEFDDRTGPVRDALASSVSTWLTAMKRAIDMAVEEGHLRADTDADQMRFEIHSLILALHYEARFLHTPGSLQRALTAFEGIVQRYSSSPSQNPPAASAVPRKTGRKLRAV